MCFSAPASFTASALLVSVGVYAITKANQRNKYYLGFALIPFLAGLQQFFEGFVWLSFEYDNEVFRRFAAYGFLFFAWFFSAILSLNLVYVVTRSKPVKR